jgi:hypothetical protein
MAARCPIGFPMTESVGEFFRKLERFLDVSLPGASEMRKTIEDVVRVSKGSVSDRHKVLSRRGVSESLSASGPPFVCLAVRGNGPGDGPPSIAIGVIQANGPVCVRDADACFEAPV